MNRHRDPSVVSLSDRRRRGGDGETRRPAGSSVAHLSEFEQLIRDNPEARRAIGRAWALGVQAGTENTLYLMRQVTSLSDPPENSA